MDSPPVSVPSQACSSAPPPSWKRSEVYDVVQPLDDALDVLRRVALVEGLRESGRYARGAAEQLSHALGHVHDLIRSLERQ